MILSFVSIKGGVGKTTMVLELAASLANDFGKRVLVVDGNFSAPNIGLYSGLYEPEITLHDVFSGEGIHNAIYEKYGFDIIPASLVNKNLNMFRLKDILSKVKSRYDFIIIDSSPNYQELIPIVVAADKLFLVTTPDFPTLSMSIKTANLAKQKKTPVEGIIINKIRNPEYELHLESIENILEIPVVARIRDDKVMAESLSKRKPILLHKRNHHISKEVRRFASAVAGEPEPKRFLLKILPFVRKEQVNRDLLRNNFYESQLN